MQMQSQPVVMPPAPVMPQVRRTWGITGPKAGPRCVYHRQRVVTRYRKRGGSVGCNGRAERYCYVVGGIRHRSREMKIPYHNTRSALHQTHATPWTFISAG